jgi:hypothetical protein
MAWLGHKSLAEAERYSLDAEQEGLADGAAALMEQNEDAGLTSLAQTELLTKRRNGAP